MRERERGEDSNIVLLTGSPGALEEGTDFERQERVNKGEKQQKEIIKYEMSVAAAVRLWPSWLMSPPGDRGAGPPSSVHTHTCC